jgi:hypothetical protein
MIRGSEALHDEPNANPVPSLNEIGRQVKRLRKALDFESQTMPDIDDSQIGSRMVGATSQSLKFIANQANPLAGIQAGLYDTIMAAIQASCEPNGPINVAISNGIQNSFNATESSRHVRQENQLSGRLNDVIRPLPLFNGDVPDPFPNTVQEFQNLNAAQVNALLNFYDLPINGTARARHSRLARFLDVTMQSII